MVHIQFLATGALSKQDVKIKVKVCVITLQAISNSRFTLREWECGLQDSASWGRVVNTVSSVVLHIQLKLELKDFLPNLYKHNYYYRRQIKGNKFIMLNKNVKQMNFFPATETNLSKENISSFWSYE